MEKDMLFSEDEFCALEEIARDTFHDYIGLNAILRAQKHFTRRDSREGVFWTSGCRDFPITQNEYVFHYIGFMDALSWLQRNFLLKEINDSSDDDIELPEELRSIEEEDKRIKTALIQFLEWAKS